MILNGGADPDVCQDDLLNAMHITVPVFINDDESGLHRDFNVWLEKLAPHEPVSQYRHNSYNTPFTTHIGVCYAINGIIRFQAMRGILPELKMAFSISNNKRIP